jgi:hypothetical protein
MTTNARLLRKFGLLAGPIAFCLVSATGWGALPEAIVPANSLPPAAGRFELWPPSAALAKWEFDIVYDGTNMPIKIHLNRIKAGSFTNIVSSVSGYDQILEFDALMETHVPLFRIGEWDEGQAALYGQVGHFRVRVVDGAKRSAGQFALVVESISWRYFAEDGEGNPVEAFHVRLLSTPTSTGWITVTNLPEGAAVMQSELLLYPEGAWFEVSTNYHPMVNAPLRMALRGTSRTLQILAVNCITNGTNKLVVLENSTLGTNYQHGLEYTTNGVNWQEHTTVDLWGQEIKWFDQLEGYATSIAPAPMKWFRLKARPRQ